jgi:hypothetical protein
MNGIGFKKILFLGDLVPFTKKIQFLLVQQKIPFDDWTRSGGEIFQKIHKALG